MADVHRFRNCCHAHGVNAEEFWAMLKRTWSTVGTSSWLFETILCLNAVQKIVSCVVKKILFSKNPLTSFAMAFVQQIRRQSDSL